MNMIILKIRSMDHSGIEKLLRSYQLIGREIHIARQQTDARSQAYFRLNELKYNREMCWIHLDKCIPEGFLAELMNSI